MSDKVVCKVPQNPAPVGKVIVQAFSYRELGKTPDGYVCDQCGAKGVKLWRDYNTVLDQQSLYCMKCACEKENKGRTSIDLFEGDQIGWRVPAVPTEEGDTYWGYTSVPSLGCIWWRSLNSPDWTDRVLVRDFRQHLKYKEMWEDCLGKAKPDGIAHYRHMLDETLVSLEILLAEINRRGITDKEQP